MMKKEQLELWQRRMPAYLNITRQRQSRARRWFQRMRHVVDQAMDWGAPPPPRPEQTFLKI